MAGDGMFDTELKSSFGQKRVVDLDSDEVFPLGVGCQVVVKWRVQWSQFRHWIASFELW